MQNELEQKLETEAAVGDRHSRTWEEVIQPFFDEKRQMLFEQFISTKTANKDDLVDIKLQLNVLQGMEAYFECVINTGKLAKQQLKEIQNG